MLPPNLARVLAKGTAHVLSFFFLSYKNYILFLKIYIQLYGEYGANGPWGKWSRYKIFLLYMCYATLYVLTLEFNI